MDLGTPTIASQQVEVGRPVQLHQRLQDVPTVVLVDEHDDRPSVVVILEQFFHDGPERRLVDGPRDSQGLGHTHA